MKFSIAAIAFALVSTPFCDAFAPRARARARARASPVVGTKFTSLAAYLDVGEFSPRNVGPFDQWVNECGVQRADGVQLTSEDNLDFYLYTSSDVPAGQPVLAVPNGMILRSSTSKQELLSMSSGGLQEAVDELGRIGGNVYVPEFYLFVKLLVEYERQEESPYYPWLDSLPRLFYNAVSMTDFCLECLPPLVFSLSRGERVKFDNICQVLKKVDVVSENVKNNKDILKWAFNVVTTRCIGEEGQDQALIPMADFLNHGTEANIDLAFDEEGNCQAYSTTDVPAGSPLLRSHGCPTNPSALFARYGLLDQSCPATFCKIMNIRKTPELENIGYDFSKMLFYKDTGDISQEVWDVVLYGKVLENAPDVRQQFYEAHMNGDMETKQGIHQYYTLDTAKEIQTHVNTFLKALDELAKKSEGKSLEEHPRLPLILEHNEYVKNTFLLVKANIDSIVAQAAEQQEYAY